MHFYAVRKYINWQYSAIYAAHTKLIYFMLSNIALLVYKTLIGSILRPCQTSHEREHNEHSRK